MVGLLVFWGRGDLLYLVAITYYETINHWNELPCKFLIKWNSFFSCNPSCFVSNDFIYDLSFRNQTPLGLRFSFSSFARFIFLKLNSTMFNFFMINKLDLFHSCICLSILRSKRFHLNMFTFCEDSLPTFSLPYSTQMLFKPKCLSWCILCGQEVLKSDAIINPIWSMIGSLIKCNWNSKHKGANAMKNCKTLHSNQLTTYFNTNHIFQKLLHDWSIDPNFKSNSVKTSNNLRNTFNWINMNMIKWEHIQCQLSLIIGIWFVTTHQKGCVI